MNNLKQSECCEKCKGVFPWNKLCPCLCHKEKGEETHVCPQDESGLCDDCPCHSKEKGELSKCCGADEWTAFAGEGSYISKCSKCRKPFTSAPQNMAKGGVSGNWNTNAPQEKGEKTAYEKVSEQAEKTAEVYHDRQDKDFKEFSTNEDKLDKLAPQECEHESASFCKNCCCKKCFTVPCECPTPKNESWDGEVKGLLGRYNAEILNKFQDEYLMQRGPGCEEILYPVLEKALQDFINPPDDGMVRDFNVKDFIQNLIAKAKESAKHEGALGQQLWHQKYGEKMIRQQNLLECREKIEEYCDKNREYNSELKLIKSDLSQLLTSLMETRE